MSTVSVKLTRPPPARLGLAGVRPPVRGRGHRSEQALLDAGRDLLKRRHFDALRLEDICAAANLTTGAFYRRFAAKEVFLASLHARAEHDMRAMLATLQPALRATGGDARKTVMAFAGPMLDWAREHRGVLRALLQRATQERGRWARFRDIAPVAVATLSPALHAALGMRRTAASERRLAIAYQIAAGAVINMIINDPGPLHLGDKRLAAELADSILSYFTLKPALHNRRAAAPSGRQP